MAEDSLLLANEHNTVGSKPSRIRTAIDQDMMEAFSSLERTEDEWIALLDKRGFNLVKVWKPAVMGMMERALYEAVPKA
jgi:hypothetical protein